MVFHYRCNIRIRQIRKWIEDFRGRLCRDSQLQWLFASGTLNAPMCMALDKVDPSLTLWALNRELLHQNQPLRINAIKQHKKPGLTDNVETFDQPGSDDRESTETRKTTLANCLNERRDDQNHLERPFGGSGAEFAILSTQMHDGRITAFFLARKFHLNESAHPKPLSSPWSLSPTK
jgi:hypothetical protein